MQTHCPLKEQLIQKMIVSYMNRIVHHVDNLDIDNADAIMQEFVIDNIEPYDQEFMFIEDLTQIR